MSPKEKALELYNKYAKNLHFIHDVRVEYNTYAKECALIAVDEILNAIQDLPIDDVNWNYWQEVKQEIEKL